LGEPITASESSTAKGTARFFAVEAGAGALFCVEEIEWTIVEVWDMVAMGEIVLVLRERWENKWHCSLLAASEARGATPSPR